MLLLVLVVVWGYRTVPRSNNNDPQEDALLVLGSPARKDGTVSAAERWRVDEAVREFRAGRAPQILFSGGAAANRFVEAQVMGAYAERQGVPASAVFEEGGSTTTVENVRNSLPILLGHGWRRVEVISSVEHLPRAALLLEGTPLLWRVHVAPTPGRSRAQLLGAKAEEAVGVTLMRIFGMRVEPILHRVDRMQQYLLKRLQATSPARKSGSRTG